jgi:hypothetical protein
MKMRLRHPAAATVRISLAAGAGALGWMILSAAAANASDSEPDRALAQPVVSIVGEAAQTAGDVTAPAVAHVKTAAGPVQKAVADAAALDPVRGLAEQVPVVVEDVQDLAAEPPVEEVVASVAAAVDTTVNDVPVVNQIVPEKTVSTVVAPVAKVLDQTVEETTGPVDEVLEPVIGGTVGAIDPDASVPPPTASEHRTARAPENGPQAKNSDAADATEPAAGPERAARHSAAPAHHRDAATVPSAATPPAGSVSPQSLSAGAAPQAATVSAGPGQKTGGQGLPADAFHGVIAPSAGGGASAGSGNSPGPVGADAPPAQLHFLLHGFPAGATAGSTLPTAPAFDPGSTPD